MHEATHCPRCGEAIGLGPVLFGSPINVVCPRCKTRCHHEGAGPIFFVVALLSMGLLAGTYFSDRRAFPIFLVALAGVNLGMAGYLRARKPLKTN